MGVIDTPAVHMPTRNVPSTNLGLSKCVRHGLQLESLMVKQPCPFAILKQQKKLLQTTNTVFSPRTSLLAR